ncbi:unnamed protein product [Acanthoscelides obtectus]|uniref:Uncharacterized protein n=1 Tax=Acanthoscelides obtectus TaxID=200917 RepID=A0A9P0JWL3_ACAOB|nr:unnamed protein product [Acanthoscelides obtectus]CAK1627887.1 hypothetical protein AOBTE_LOCUS4886 [Acanthoscelides obtectus]
MPKMPSVDMGMNTMTTMIKDPPQFNISSKDVENLVLEIKENLRLTTASTTMKSLSCTRLSRKSSRTSPYQKPGKVRCDTLGCSSTCKTCKVNKYKPQPSELTEDPYELLQKLLRDGSLVNEAVRRVQLGISPKHYFYESDDESKSPMLRFIPQEN